MTLKKGRSITQCKHKMLIPKNRLGASRNPEQELFKEFQKFLAAQQSSENREEVQLSTLRNKASLIHRMGEATREEGRFSLKKT